MLQIAKLKSESDNIGAIASILCFLHCLATPFLFVAQTGLGHLAEVKNAWWGSLDLVFLGVSLFAVYWSIRTTSKNWMKYAFGFFWLLLFLFVCNEKLGLMHLAEVLIYVPTLGLILLHRYNRQYCQCDDGDCCTDKS